MLSAMFSIVKRKSHEKKINRLKKWIQHRKRRNIAKNVKIINNCIKKRKEKNYKAKKFEWNKNKMNEIRTIMKNWMKIKKERINKERIRKKERSEMKNE